LIEGLFQVFVDGVNFAGSFPALFLAEVMDRCGSDVFLRITGMELKDLSLRWLGSIFLPLPPH
jgi:hypothetical protein